MFNNRYLVIALAVIAIALVTQRIVKPLLETRGSERLSQPQVTEDYTGADVANALTGTGIDTRLQGAQFDAAQRDVRSITVDTLHWNTRPLRDPYAPSTRQAQDRSLPLSATQSPASPFRWPRVSAVVDSRRHQYAIVNGVIRKPGDQFDGFRLDAIEKQTVSLTHSVSRSTRTIEVSTK